MRRGTGGRKRVTLRWSAGRRHDREIAIIMFPRADRMPFTASYIATFTMA
jgi:hypothetical protein